MAQDFILKTDDNAQLHTAPLLLKLTVSWWHQEVTPGSQSLKLGICWWWWYEEAVS